MTVYRAGNFQSIPHHLTSERIDLNTRLGKKKHQKLSFKLGRIVFEVRDVNYVQSIGVLDLEPLRKNNSFPFLPILGVYFFDIAKGSTSEFEILVIYQ